MSSDSDSAAITIADTWLAGLASASRENDIAAFVEMFDFTGWLRDLLCLSLDFRTLPGRTNISNYLSDMVGYKTRLAAAGLDTFALDTSSSIGPPKRFDVPGDPDANGIQGAFKFTVKSPAAIGRGYFRIVEGESGWKAFTVLLSLNDFIGHEEYVGSPLGMHVAREATTDERNGRVEEAEAIERDLTVLVIGGGQTGLMCAARLRRLGIRALVVEKTARIGDVWRNRYPTLTLHTVAKHCSLLYQPYPADYPKYIPKDALADFLEVYAKDQGIHVWLSSTVLPISTYDASSRRWSVPVDHAGKKVILNPKHIIMANGNAKPNIPKFPGMESFRGTIYHSDRHKGADLYRGKKVIVVGAAVSAGDMCIEFVAKGASEVTLVQRSAVCVSSQFVSEKALTRYAQDGPVEDMDFVSNSMPNALVLQLAAAGGTEQAKAIDKNMLGGLREAGFKLTWELTPGGGEVGITGFILEKGSAGTLMDVGSSQLIIDGKVKMQGTEIKEIVKDGVIFQDGSKTLADVIILATGYEPFIQNAKDLFGEEITEKVGTKIWGLDGEGEPKAAYRPTGQPGLWFAVGAFHSARFLSKHLALQILAQELVLQKS